MVELNVFELIDNSGCTDHLHAITAPGNMLKMPASQVGWTRFCAHAETHSSFISSGSTFTLSIKDSFFAALISDSFSFARRFSDSQILVFFKNASTSACPQFLQITAQEKHRVRSCVLPFDIFYFLVQPASVFDFGSGNSPWTAN